MKKKNGSFFKRMSFFNRETLSSIKLLPQILTVFEKVVLIFLGLLIALSSLFIWRNHWLKNTNEVPASGGTYVEGIVGEPKNVDKHIARLIGAGLTKLAPNGDVHGDLASSWEIQEDGKLYNFKLREGFFSSDLVSQIKNKNIWPNIEIDTPSEDTITFRFKQPFSPFLYASTEPIFSYGPYRISKEEKDKITLQAVESYWQGEPHIEKIVLNLYSDEASLLKAVKNGDLMGYITEQKNDIDQKRFTTYELALPRELDLFFNLSREDLKNAELRRNIRDYKPLAEEHNWTLVTSENTHNVQMAGEIKNRWKNLKINLEIKTYNNIDLQKDVIPKRDYDLLLYGLDYGPDPDPYPFWHSSQIGEGGKNLSNFSNKSADKLLEDARQTFDFNLRGQKYDEFKKILDEEAPFITIEKESLYCNIAPKVKGIEKIYGYSESDRFLDVFNWYIKSKRIKN